MIRSFTELMDDQLHELMNRDGADCSLRPAIPANLTASELRDVAAVYLRQDLRWIDSPEFHTAESVRILVEAEPSSESRPAAGHDADDELGRYFGTDAVLPLLSQSDEAFFFRRMNYLKYLAHEELSSLNPNRPSVRSLRRAADYLRRADADRNRIARHNLRLVVPLARKAAPASASVFDYISEGNAALLRAIRGFDYSRGFKFSTYATWAVRRSLSRLRSNAHRDAARCVATEPEVLHSVDGDIVSETEERIHHKHVHRVASELLEKLDDRSRRVVALRFGIDTPAEPATLQEVGQELGVSRERVRQIEQAALRKMARAARVARLDDAVL